MLGGLGRAQPLPRLPAPHSAGGRSGGRGAAVGAAVGRAAPGLPRAFAEHHHRVPLAPGPACPDGSISAIQEGGEALGV